jgi:hypothetical protein
MARLFARACEVLIGKGGQALILQMPLRFQFKAVKSLTKDPNSLELTISNLSKQSQAHLQGKGVDIVVQAGYAEQAGIIYSGQIRTVDHVIEKGGGWSSKIKCGDTSGASGGAGKPCVSNSWGAGTQTSNVAMDLVGSLGILPGNLQEQLAANGGGQQYATGYAAFGHPARELEKVLKTLGLTHSVQDGELLVLRDDETAKHFERVVLTPETGLISSPELGTPEEKGGAPVMKAKSLLNHKIKAGAELSIQARDVKGIFKIQKVTHHGDSHGEAWFTEVEASRLK